MWPYVLLVQVIIYYSISSFTCRPKFWATGKLTVCLGDDLSISRTQYIILTSGVNVKYRLTQNFELKTCRPGWFVCQVNLYVVIYCNLFSKSMQNILFSTSFYLIHIKIYTTYNMVRDTVLFVPDFFRPLNKS